MANYRVHKVFDQIPSILGMDLVLRGQKWEGPYYLNGDRHAYRRDKLKVAKWKGDIWLFEEGGSCMSLTTWLVNNGRASDYWDAIRLLEGERQPFVYDAKTRQKTPELRYISPDVLAGARGYDLNKCNLFRWMCRMFPEERVRAVWERYNVTTDSHGNCVYWYTDQNGHILFDKRILYKEDGHRDKGFFPGRQYRVADGYTGKCYFGANTVPESGKIYVCESEKTAILVNLMYGRTALATGGKNNLRDVDKRMLLLPDMDAIEEWSAHGEVWPWWEKWGKPIDEIPDHADIGDMIVDKRLI